MSATPPTSSGEEKEPAPHPPTQASEHPPTEVSAEPPSGEEQLPAHPPTQASQYPPTEVSAEPPASQPPSSPPPSGAERRPSQPPPSSGGQVPAGPPSGPLSGAPSGSGQLPGPSGSGSSIPPPPPPTPPTEPPGRSGPGGTPWWRRPVSLGVGVLIVGLATALAVTLSGGPAAAKPVLLQPAGSPGPDPYTSSPTKAPPPAVASTIPSASASSTTASGAKVVSGSSVGLYGGTENQASCDVNQLSTFLTTHPEQGRAWAGVEGIAQSEIPAYLHTLTPVVLRVDTRVTNHGFSNGQATTFQSVLQAGTAVLVDDHGVPRARCSCGNPLLPPAVQSSEAFTGTQWQTFRPQEVVVVEPAPVEVTVIVLYDPETGQYFGRPKGGSGHGDVKVPPPTGSSSTSSSTSTGSTSSSGTSTSSSSSGSTSGTTSSGTSTPSPAGSLSSTPSSVPSEPTPTPTGAVPATP